MTPRRLMERRASSPVPLKPPWDGYFIAALCGGPRLHGLRKDSRFDYALKGCASYQGMPSGIPQIAEKKTRVETGLTPSKTDLQFAGGRGERLSPRDPAIKPW
jgi:hypothetical protein